ncbi:MAG: HAMP domain-containing histidine kinase [Thermodesulfobacteria bacterium]|nr:HAMP domain-containing histidine kinase [Thermodesulfobacteriota bacterium]
MFKRFIISFSALIIFISAYFAYTSITFTKEILDELESRQAVRLVSFVLDKGNLLDEKGLLRLQRMLGGEVFVYSKAGDLLATTMDRGLVPDSLRKIPPKILEKISQKPVVQKISFAGETYRFVLFEAQISEGISGYFGLLLPTVLEQKIQKRLMFGLIYTAFSGLVFMLVVSWFLSRSFTQPLEELVDLTKKIAEGKWTERVEAKGPPEVRTLARAFNEMSSKLHEYQQRLIETERLATAAQLTASIAHEIKNPLTSLKLGAEILREFLKDDPALARRAELIFKETLRLEKILENMRARTRKIEIVRRKIDLNTLTREVVEIATPQFEARKQKLRLELAKEPLLVEIDPEKMKQVLWNLLNNALEVTPEGGEVIVKTRAGENGYEIVVEDSGPGIPEEKIKDLFRPFYTTKPEGTGLGLAISKQIVLFHGGELILENRPEGGARARVILPPAAEARKSARKPAQNPPEEDTPR